LEKRKIKPMENINTPPTLNETFSELSKILEKPNIFSIEEKLQILKIHELRVLNFYLSDINTSLISIANDITTKP